MSDQPDDGFLTRWARRKAQVTVEAAKPSASVPAKAEPDPEPTQAEIDAYVATLPKLDDFTALTDLRPFLNRLVPQVLQLAAMRRVWALDPMVRDFVNDAREYAYDWNVPGGAPGYGPLETTQEMRDWVMNTLARATPEPEISNQPDQSDIRDKTPQMVVDTPSETLVDHAAMQKVETENTEETPGNGDTGVPVGLSAHPLRNNPARVVIAASHNDTAPVRVRHGGALPR